VEEIRANKNHLTPQVNQFYEGSDFKKIKQRMREKIQRLVVTGKQQKDSTTSGYEEATTRFGNQVRVELTLFGQHA
jgi:chromosome condensin MukBEF MukE localization factor